MSNDTTTAPPGTIETPSAVELTEPARLEAARFETARRLTLELRKASPAWLQRQLGISYNEALRHVERMEKEGVVTAPDHVGRREVLTLKHS